MFSTKSRRLAAVLSASALFGAGEASVATATLTHPGAARSFVLVAPSAQPAGTQSDGLACATGTS